MLLFGSRKQLGKAVVKASVEYKKSHILPHDRNTLLKFYLLPFLYQIEPSHQNNLDSRYNQKQMKESSNKGKERKGRPMVTSDGGGASEHHYKKQWRSSRFRPWLRWEREFEIAERGSEMDLVVEGYKSGGCSGGGVFVSWIEAWERLRKEWDKKKKKEESSFTQKRD